MRILLLYLMEPSDRPPPHWVMHIKPSLFNAIRRGYGDNPGPPKWLLGMSELPYWMMDLDELPLWLLAFEGIVCSSQLA